MPYVDARPFRTTPFSPWTRLVGAGDWNDALDDSTDTSYVDANNGGLWDWKSGGGLATVFCWLAIPKGQIPAGARIYAMQPIVRTIDLFGAHLAGLTKVTLFIDQGGNNWASKKYLEWNGFPTNSWKTHVGPRYNMPARNKFKNPYLTAGNGSSAHPVPMLAIQWGRNSVALSQVRLRIHYHAKPTFTITSLTANEAGSSNVRVSFSYHSPLGLRGRQVYIYDAQGREVYGPDLDRDNKREIVESGDTTFTVPQSLPAGRYTLKMRIASKWPDGYQDPPFWSDWKQKTFTVTPFVNTEPTPGDEVVQTEALATPTVRDNGSASERGWAALKIDTYENLLSLNQSSAFYSEFTPKAFGNATVTTTSEAGVASSGVKAWKVTPATNNATFTVGTYPMGALVAGKTLRFGAKYRSATSTASVKLTAFPCDDAGQQAGDVVEVQGVTKVGEWTELRGEITVPEGATQVDLISLFTDTASGEVHYVDDQWVALASPEGNNWSRGGLGNLNPVYTNKVPFTLSEFEYDYRASDWNLTNCTATYESAGTSLEDLGKSLALTPTDTGVDMTALCTNYFPVGEEAIQHLGAHFRSATTTARNCSVRIFWYDEQHNLLSDDTVTPAAGGASNTRAKVVNGGVTPPTGAAFFRYSVSVLSASEKHFVDAVYALNTETPSANYDRVGFLQEEGVLEAGAYRAEVQYSDDDGATWTSFNYMPEPVRSAAASPYFLFNDYLAHPGRLYRARTIANVSRMEWASNWSEPFECPTLGAANSLIVARQGVPGEFWAPEFATAKRSVSRANDSGTRLFVGRTRPTAEAGEVSARTVKAEVQDYDFGLHELLFDSEYDDVQLALRDSRGLALEGHVSSMSVQDTAYGHELDFEFKEGRNG